MQNREVLVGMVADGSLYIQMYIRHSPTQEDQVKESQRQTMNFRLPVGVLTALVIADVTNGTGRFNLAQGLVGTASGIGASLSTALFGLIAVNLGRTLVFLSVAIVALLAVLILWFLMPETRPPIKPVGLSQRDPHSSLAATPDQHV